MNNDLKDKHGLPTLTFDAILRDNEYKMRKDMANDAAEMLSAGGFKNVGTYDREIGIGLVSTKWARPAWARILNLGIEQVESGARVQERLCHGWFIHDFCRMSQSAARIHGIYRAGSRPRSK